MPLHEAREAAPARQSYSPPDVDDDVDRKSWKFWQMPKSFHALKMGNKKLKSKYTEATAMLPYRHSPTRRRKKIFIASLTEAKT